MKKHLTKDIFYGYLDYSLHTRKFNLLKKHNYYLGFFLFYYKFDYNYYLSKHLGQSFDYKKINNIHDIILHDNHFNLRSEKMFTYQCLSPKEKELLLMFLKTLVPSCSNLEYKVFCDETSGLEIIAHYYFHKMQFLDANLLQMLCLFEEIQLFRKKHNIIIL